MYQHLTTPRDDEKINDYASEYIDVRDVADAFVAALKIDAAGNERFILDAGTVLYSSPCVFHFLTGRFICPISRSQAHTPIKTSVRIYTPAVASVADAKVFPHCRQRCTLDGPRFTWRCCGEPERAAVCVPRCLLRSVQGETHAPAEGVQKPGGMCS